MPRVRFTSDFDCRVGLHTVRAYKKGMEILVSQECASKAVVEDKAVLLLAADDAARVPAEHSESRDDPTAPSPAPSPAGGRGSEGQKPRRPRRPRREVV